MDKRVIVGSGLGVVVLGVLALAYIGVFARPSAALAKAAEQMLMAPTFHATTELQIHLPTELRGRLRPFTNVEVMIDGDVARAEDRTLELTGTLEAEARGPGNTLFTHGELRLLHDAVAFRLEDFPVLLNPTGSLVKKWTYVKAPVLSLKNSEAVPQAWGELNASLVYRGKETVDGNRVLRFQGMVTPEQEIGLINLFKRSVSGNEALDVIARLLAANDVDSLTVDIDARTKTLRRINAHFVRPLPNGNVFDFATLTISLSDFGQPVQIDRPPAELTVQSRVFSKLFGSGEIEAIR